MPLLGCPIAERAVGPMVMVVEPPRFDLLIGPVIEHPARQFRSLVEHDLLGNTSFGDEPIQHLDHSRSG
ncbi:MAG: hypothetical protein ACREMZ_17040, partial [Gemmatimonadales bacterium]